MIVLLPCGSKKAKKAMPAALLYEGAYFGVCRAYALSVAPASNIYILSAKHGLVRSAQILEPYNLRFSSPFAVTKEKVRAQVLSLGLQNETAMILGGEEYVMRASGLFHEEILFVKRITPAVYDARMGYQMEWMNKHKGIIP